MKSPWNKCTYCGKFIAYEDFSNNKAINVMITPDSEVTFETYDTYHMLCKRKDEEKTVYANNNCGK